MIRLEFKGVATDLTMPCSRMSNPAQDLDRQEEGCKVESVQHLVRAAMKVAMIKKARQNHVPISSRYSR